MTRKIKMMKYPYSYNVEQLWNIDRENSEEKEKDSILLSFLSVIFQLLSGEDR